MLTCRVWVTGTIDDAGLSSTTGLDVIKSVAASDPSKLLAAMVQVLPKDFQVNITEDQVQWVINAAPMTVSDWVQTYGAKREHNQDDT